MLHFLHKKRTTCNSSNYFMFSLRVQFLSTHCIDKNLPVPCFLFYSSQNGIEIAHTDWLWSICISYMSGQPCLTIFGIQSYQSIILNLVMHLLLNYCCCKWKQIFRVNKPSFSIVDLTNRFHVTLHLFSNRSHVTSECGKKKEVAHKMQLSLMQLSAIEIERP